MNNFKTILGAILGALLSSIPWILVYVFGGYMLSILTLLIALGSYKFYKLFGGTLTKKTSTIIIVISILTITLINFIIIPLILLNINGYISNIDNLKLLYNTEGFISSIISDYVISLLFTILGISGVISNIKKEYNNIDKIDNKTEEELINEIRNIYKKYDATNKENAISNKTITNDLNINNPNNELLNLIKKGIIINYKGKTYFDEEAYKNPNKANININKLKKKNTIIIILVIIFTAVITLFIEIPSNNNKDLIINFYESNITLPNTYYLSNDDSTENLYMYYSNNANNIIDIIALLKSDYTIDYKNIYISSLENDYEIINESDTETGFKVTYKSEDCYFIDYVYYIDNNVYSVIFATTKLNLNNEFIKETEKINNTFTINKKENI